MNRRVKGIRRKLNKITLDIDSKDLIKITSEKQWGYKDTNQSNDILIKDDGKCHFKSPLIHYFLLITTQTQNKNKIRINKFYFN